MRNVGSTSHSGKTGEAPKQKQGRKKKYSQEEWAKDHEKCWSKTIDPEKGKSPKQGRNK